MGSCVRRGKGGPSGFTVHRGGGRRRGQIRVPK